MNARAWARICLRKHTRMTVAEVAHGLEVPVRLVRDWIARGYLTCHWQTHQRTGRDTYKRKGALIRTKSLARALEHPAVIESLTRVHARAAGLTTR